ncbi:MAG: DNA topoisomerase IV subunit B, partial [Bacteroidetes bacterium]|nr:DNA topoisomerase IV subunit B [Bacteroidota bacterium]
MMEETKPKPEYSASSIQVLEGLEAVRKRPAMYIGDTGVKGLHHLVYEVVDNSIDEALAGYCKNIFVSILPGNAISVRDDGRGIPTDIHPKEGVSALQVVMTVLHAGGKFDKDTYKVSGGLHGVGVSCVNALSTHLKTEVHRNGKKFIQEYSEGKPLYPVKEEGTSDYRGTIQTFQPDATIFTTTTYNYDTLAGRLRELAFLNKGISLTLTDEREPQEDGTFFSTNFYSEGGLIEFVKFLDSTREPIIPEPVYVEGGRDSIAVEVALQYNTSYSENVHSYVNNINTIEGGTHVAGFRRALTRTFKSFGDKNKLFEKLKVEIT